MASGPKPGTNQLYTLATPSFGDLLPPRSTPASFVLPTSKKRTAHACDRCRLMRTKCSGGRRCNRCMKDDTTCVYGDHKRERNKKDLANNVNRVKYLEAQNRVLVSALRQTLLPPESRSMDNEGIRNLLAQYPDDSINDNAETFSSHNRSFRDPAMHTESKSEQGGESVVASSVGSPGSQGEIRKLVDLDHGTGAAGFIGKISEMSWMQRCREYIDNQPSITTMDVDSPKIDMHTTTAGDLLYFVDDEDLLAVDEDHIDAFQLPQPEAALITTEAYFHATGGAFQFLPQDEVSHFMYNLPQDGRALNWQQCRWLALANLVWAVGTKWLYIAGLNGHETFENHLVYYARARALGMDHRISFDHPDLDAVQAMGVLAFYLLINGSISRAWNTVGNAIRHAMTLGLHLKVSGPFISPKMQVRRARIWFSLYRLQISIAEITGRPQLIRSAHVTIAMEILQGYAKREDASPALEALDLTSNRQAYAAWQSHSHNMMAVDDMDVKGKIVIKDTFSLDSNSLHNAFVYQIRLCQLSEKIADQLYTGRHEIPWSETQRRIEELQQGLDAWTATLPESLSGDAHEQTEHVPRVNIHLAMYAHSITMILHRPCLCEIMIENESDRSRTFNFESAKTCVKSALSILDLIPDSSTIQDLNRHFPWWALLHYLCQASSVLLLELCLNTQHFYGESAQVVAALLKAMSLIAIMAPQSMSAYKAWRIFDHLLRRMSLGADNSSVLHAGQPAPPPGWSTVHERDLLTALR